MEKRHLDKFSSENYDFHYFKDSIAERDINEIATIQEQCFQEISDLLNISPKIRIQYYLVDSPKLVGEIYGDNEPCNGFAKAPNEIYAVYSEEIKCIGHHEDAHILSYTINRPNSNFIREGLAMYFDKYWRDKTNEEWVRSFLLENKYIKIHRLLLNDIFFSYPDQITYPIAGAFTKFLIDVYGIERYIEIYKYKGEEFSERIKEIYLSDIETIEEEFIIFLTN